MGRLLGIWGYGRRARLLGTIKKYNSPIPKHMGPNKNSRELDWNETQQDTLLLLIVRMMTIGSNQRYRCGVESALIVTPVQWRK
ncbi:hypothetical protein M0802_001331 [Mischocyttarus mexicanus]|nr:hypothetical protein M0802_001331 [Mischocyttarus mexicanus]